MLSFGRPDSQCLACSALANLVSFLALPCADDTILCPSSSFPASRFCYCVSYQRWLMSKFCVGVINGMW